MEHSDEKLELTDNTVEARVSRLEQEVSRQRRACRYWRGASLLLLVGMGVGILMGAGSKQHRVVEAEAFVLRASDGKIRAVLGPASDGPAGYRKGDGLYFYAPDGRVMAELAETYALFSTSVSSLDGGGAWTLGIYGKNTNSTAGIRVEDGTISFALMGTSAPHEQKPPEEQRAWNASHVDGDGVWAQFLVSSDKSGYAGFDLRRDGQGTALDARGAIRMTLSEGNPTLSLTDAEGKERAILGPVALKKTVTGIVEQRPASSLVFFDQSGKSIWKAP
jgi:hypothetical protein